VKVLKRENLHFDVQVESLTLYTMDTVCTNIYHKTQL
jgi:hypothetical protein